MSAPVVCPEWCDFQADHKHPDDIVHISVEHTVELALEPQIEMVGAAEGEPTRQYMTPDWLSLYIRQDQHDAEPSIHLGRNYGAGVTLTIDEAKSFFLAVVKVVGIAEGAR